MTFESEKQIWERLKHVSDPLERRLRFVAWLTRALEPHGVRPVVVGGHALEFYTLGGYATGDIDLVCVDLEPVRQVLERAGFRRIGRHWYREDVDILVEFPGSTLAGSPDKVEQVLLDEGVIYIIGKEDLLIDRLNACVHWESAEDCRWAKRLLALYGSEMDWPYLRERARQEGTWERLEALWASVQEEMHDSV